MRGITRCFWSGCRGISVCNAYLYQRIWKTVCFIKKLYKGLYNVGGMRYDSLGEYYCSVCGRRELNDYGKVRKFLDENGSSPAPVIEAATGVPLIVINELLDIGKVQIPNGAAEFLKCQQCGRNITFGRICPNCAQNMSAGLKGAFQDGVGELAPRQQSRPKPVAKEKRPRMYTAGMRKK